MQSSLDSVSFTSSSSSSSPSSSTSSSAHDASIATSEHYVPPPSTPPLDNPDALLDKLKSALEDFHLSPFAFEGVKLWLKKMAACDSDSEVDTDAAIKLPKTASSSSLSRARAWIIMRLNGRSRVQPQHPLQQGCPEVFPLLTAKPWWDNAAFDWVHRVESKCDVIKQELLGLRGVKGGFRPFRQPSWAGGGGAGADAAGSKSHDSGDWNVCYLQLHDFDLDDMQTLCPQTLQILRDVPRIYRHSMFSAITPGTHIIPHNGPTNKKLRVHLGIMGCDGASIRVGEETRCWQDGKVIIFDDSFEHEVRHEGACTRFVLIFDIWHPDFSADEVRFIDTLYKARFRAERRAAAAGHDHDSFYSLLEKSKYVLDSAEWWGEWGR